MVVENTCMYVCSMGLIWVNFYPRYSSVYRWPTACRAQAAGIQDWSPSVGTEWRRRARAAASGPQCRPAVNSKPGPHLQRRQWHPLQYSCWKIPWTEEPGRLQSMGSWRVGHDWAASLSLFTFMHWRRKWQPTPVFFPGESQGRGSLVGCHLWGHTESDTEAT